MAAAAQAFPVFAEFDLEVTSPSEIRPGNIRRYTWASKYYFGHPLKRFPLLIGIPANYSRAVIIRAPSDDADASGLDIAIILKVTRVKVEDLQRVRVEI